MSRGSIVASAFARTLWRARRLRTRTAILRHQADGVRRLLDHAAATTRFYQPFAGADLPDVPIVDKAMHLADFAAFNSRGMSVDEAWAAIEGGACPGHEVGASTGTSGRRGLYLVSHEERFRWLGTILAKTIPDVAPRRHRVAIVLPGPSPLYQAANESRMLKLRHFDARGGLAGFAEPVAAFDPTVLVGAPKSLRGLARAGVRSRPRRVFAAAEVLDPADRRIVEQAFGVTLGQIYMATEGLLGTSCRHGVLHLAEDVAAFELEPIPGDETLVTPLFTDFTRRVQVMARYRLGDLLRLDPTPCACGSAMRRVDVVGRLEDLVMAAGIDGRPVPLAPDRLRDALLAADPHLDDYRIGTDGGAPARSIRVLLPIGSSQGAIERARRALSDLCRARGAVVAIEAATGDLAAPFDRKLRRVVAAPPSGL